MYLCTSALSPVVSLLWDMICPLGDLVPNQCLNLPPEGIADLSSNFTVKQPLGLSVTDYVIESQHLCPRLTTSNFIDLHAIFLLRAIKPDELALHQSKSRTLMSAFLSSYCKAWGEGGGGGVTHMLLLVRHHGTQKRPRADLGCLAEHALEQSDGYCIPSVLSHIRPREICLDHAGTAGVDYDSWTSFNHGWSAR